MHILAKKDFYVRYRRASIGLLWAIGLPLVQSLVLAFIFSRVVPLARTKIPYPVFVLSGMIPWSFFSGSISSATTAIVDGSGLASRVYFPRAMLPIISIWSGYRAYAPSIIVLVGMAAAFRAPLGWHLLLLVPATILVIALITAFSLVLAGLQVYFRDIRYIVQAAILPWFFVSGVIIPVSTLERKIGKLIELNPAIGVIQLYRSAFGSVPAWSGSALIAILWTVCLTCIAIPMYQRHDRNFADRL